MGKFQFQYGEILKESWEKLKKNYGIILGILAVVMVVSGGFALFVRLVKESAPGLGFLLQLASFAVNTFLSIGLIRCLLKAADDEPVVFSDLFSGTDVFLAFLLGNLLYILVFFGGLLLLIIPGIIFSIKYSFFGYLIVDQGMGVKESFSRSGNITYGYKWNLFVLGILAGLINLGGILLFGVGLLVTFPLTAMFGPVVYRKLAGSIQAETYPEQGASSAEDDNSFNNQQ